MEYQSANKRIAKNTVLLYLRSLFMIAIGIYTSRIVLQALGVENYGLYGVVGTFVAMFAFVNDVLSIGTSRFITFELGKNDIDAVKKVFNAGFIMHCAMSLLVFILLETIGLWFLNNKLNIPVGREAAANWVYQFSILTCCFSLTQVPYRATIIAHERLDLYAYVGIAEAIFKCIVPIVLLYFNNGDVLVLYALMLATWSVCLQIFYRVYCKKHFPETGLCIVRDKAVYESMLSYSLWDFLGQMCATLNIQGITVLINMFFGVRLNAAQNIANQLQGQVQGFINNFTTSVNPQIVKSYAKGDYSRFFQLINESGKYSYYMFLFLALPLFLECDYILSIWLVEVPEHTSSILRGILIILLLRTPANAVVKAVHATGDVKYLNLTSGLQAVIIFLPGTYLCFKMGFPYWSYLIIYAITQFNGTIFEIVSLNKNIQFDIKAYINNVYVRVFYVTLISSVLPIISVISIPSGLLRFVITGFLCVVSCGTCILYVGISKDMRERLYVFLCKKLKTKLTLNI